MASGPVRAFIAVPCGEQLAAELSRRLDAAAGRVAVRWTHPRTWHLTLQFLGDWPADRLQRLRTALVDVAAAVPPPLVPAGWGGFPDRRRPRVLFLQFAPAEPVSELARRVRQASAIVWPDGPQDTRPAHLHLTLARVREPLEAGQLNAVLDIDLSGLPELPVERFCLLASDLRPQGARHTELASYGLRKKGE
ncbi:RNA 2',3'-cyclic phosphodiesterase [bacterium]|nr:RNA 2',3'-cyclic phosphodiesterase [bacterium]